METLFRNILVLLPNWIGDVVMCTPALRALRRQFPEAVITVAGRAAACELVRGLPGIEREAVLPKRNPLTGWLDCAGRLRPMRFDLAVVFPHSFRAALVARLSGAPHRLGYARDRRTFLLTDAMPAYKVDGRIQPIYMAQEYLGLVRSIGCEDDGQGLELCADEAIVSDIASGLEGSRPLVGIAPGAAFGPSKLWPLERYAAVADRLSLEAGARCVLLTGPGEERIRDAVLAAVKGPLPLTDDRPLSIARLKALISRLDLLVCNDSGPRHIAVAFNVPTVCLMGPTSPAYSTGPYERGALLRVDVYCGPCQKPVCATDHRCMHRISVDWVVKSAIRAMRTQFRVPSSEFREASSERRV
ncbi:MAG: lipopolysaccharide heptosyltransferase II [Candidatus Hydrogenedentes bacterium]|nr:lipopolysaccharide heptosyltransferase II [Candidatus Hydrogenedentota bacterium]